MINKVFTGKEDISYFTYNPDYSFSYEINPEYWYRCDENLRYDTFPISFSNYFYSLETLEKIGGKGVWIISEYLSMLHDVLWKKVMKHDDFCFKPAPEVSDIFIRDLLELGISEDILKDKNMKIIKFDIGKNWLPQLEIVGLGVVGIVIDSNFCPIWWDPFNRF